ncbi:MAG: energy-coupling factor transporter transmembrane component T family protein [Eggerthellaceae bacterium]|jgi:energy-coupling factor transport system permease protein
MPTVLLTYLPRRSAVHRTDARVKIVVLFAYSIGLFFVETWAGIALYLAGFMLVCACSKLPARRLLAALVPLYAILFFTWLFNAFTLDPSHVAEGYSYGAPASTAGPFAGMGPITIVGSLAFLPAGCATGCFVILRILLLTLASLVVAYSTPSTQLVGAIARFLGPLRRLRVPVDDVAMVLSLALRFIPLFAQEADSIRLAQLARGAHFDDRGFWSALKAWGSVFIPLIVSLFRRAERIGQAFDARCYGAAPVRTRLHDASMTSDDAAILCVGLLGCAACSLLL